MENRIEILAPAGGFDSLQAAVRSGADAVYLGEKLFSARSSAKNFDDEELKNAVAYCHIHGVKVYVTINTLVFDDEFELLKHAITAAAKSDADALIVQNQGVARLARKIAPELPLHASTQMSIHTASGVRALYEMGFKRVVLAREMSAEEIQKCAEIPVELEVFVHGALCMSVSGQCYFSAMLGGRSGNRGLCAQTCRLPFSVGNNKEGYALSLKDNSLISHIGELEKFGVASAKIEGRMKRPEYVSAAVRACREQRDFGFVTEETARLLRGAFSRTGFTDGYYTGKTGREMFGTRTKSDVVSADENLFSAIRQTYKDEIRNVEINGKFTARLGKKPVFQVNDGTHYVTVISNILCEKAEKISVSAEKCRNQLSKTGGTAYKFKKLEIDIDDNISIPVSALNAMRRETLEILDKKRSIIHNYTINDVDVLRGLKPFDGKRKAVRARFENTKIGEGFKACELIFVPLFSPAEELKRLKSNGFKIGVEIPRGMFGCESRIDKSLKKAKEIGIDDVLCHNIGALYQAKCNGMTLHGGFGLNIVNTYDLLWAQDYGLKSVELSMELTFERINRLKGEIDRGIISYGYLPLMLCRNCPDKSGGIDCKSCKNKSKMQDRKNKQFYLKCDGICTEVLNCVPLFIADEEISKLLTSFNILNFTVENYVENVKDIADFKGFSMLKDNFTRGLYKRGVE